MADCDSTVITQINELHNARAMLAGCMAMCPEGDALWRLISAADSRIDAAIDELDDVYMHLLRSKPKTVGKKA